MGVRPSPVALLLDLDDTILDDNSSIRPSWTAVCEEAAGRVSGLDAGALFATTARIAEWYWSDPDRHREGRQDLRAARLRIVQQALFELGFNLPELASWVGERYRDLREAAVRPFPGAVEALNHLREFGLGMALVTNGAGPAQRAKIDRFDLARHFDHILIEGELGYGKPDHRVYLTAMQMLGSQPADTWIVGDNLEWEVAVPQRLGIYAFWVDHSYAGLPAGNTVKPDRIIHSITELPDLVREYKFQP